MFWRSGEVNSRVLFFQIRFLTWRSFLFFWACQAGSKVLNLRFSCFLLFIELPVFSVSPLRSE